MKPIASPLNILDFSIMNLEFNFIHPDDKGKDDSDLRNYFVGYDLDIDFGIHSNEIIQVFIKAEINRGEKKLPGYSIFAEAACIFEFNKKINISEEAKNSIEGFSTIYIALNTMRGFVSQLTANAPLGRYILPSVDLNDLINQKKSALINKNKKVAAKNRIPAKK